MGQGEAQHLQALHVQFLGQHHHAGDAAAWPRQAHRQAIGHRVGAGEAHDDGDLRIKRADRMRGRVGDRDDHIRTRREDLGRERREARGIAIRRACDQAQRASFDETLTRQFGQAPLAELVNRDLPGGQQAEPRDATLRLGGGGKRQ